jgi:hypothetical protein
MKLYVGSNGTGMSYIQREEGRLSGLITSYLGNYFLKTLLRKDSEKNESDGKTRKRK